MEYFTTGRGDEDNQEQTFNNDASGVNDNVSKANSGLNQTED